MTNLINFSDHRGMSQRKGKILHKPSEAVELDGDLSFPHTPMHLPMLEQTDRYCVCEVCV